MKETRGSDLCSYVIATAEEFSSHLRLYYDSCIRDSVYAHFSFAASSEQIWYLHLNPAKLQGTTVRNAGLEHEPQQPHPSLL